MESELCRFCPEPPPPLSLELPLLEEPRSIFLLVSVEWVRSVGLLG